MLGMAQKEKLKIKFQMTGKKVWKITVLTA